MKRNCTANDIRILKRNKTLFLSGVAEKERGNNPILIGISLIPALAAFLAILYFSLTTDRNLFGAVPLFFAKKLSQALMLVSVFACYWGIKKGYKRLGGSLKKSAILHDKTLSINAAIVFGSPALEGYIFFQENCVVSPDGRIPILRYPASASDCKRINAGDKLLVLYSATKTALVRCSNEETLALFEQLNTSLTGERADSVSDLFFLPHVNALQVLTPKHPLTALDRQFLEERFHATERKLLLRCAALLGFLYLMALAFILTLNRLDHQSIPTRYAAYITLGLLVLSLLNRILFRKRRKEDFMMYDMVQDVIFDEKTLLGGGKNHNGFITVYEYTNPEFQLTSYENYGDMFSGNAPYGAIIRAYSKNEAVKFFKI